MANKWQIGPVKLASGDEAFIDAINAGQEANRYTGRIKGTLGDWIPVGWRYDGCRMWSTSNDPFNLTPPPKKTVRVQGWLVVFANGKTLYFGYSDKDTAVTEANVRGFALIPIDREVTEGEGL
jgi:hypothetical protein